MLCAALLLVADLGLLQPNGVSLLFGVKAVKR